MIGRKSTTVPGQLCVSTSGVTSGSGERTCRKCTFCPSIVVVYCGYALSLASQARQSYSCRQRRASSRTRWSGTP